MVIHSNCITRTPIHQNTDMSFTAPLWNELVFEKINELQVAHQETMKHLSNLSRRLIHMENRISQLSSGLNVVVTYLHKEARDNFPARPISATPTPTPTNITSIANYNTTSVPMMTPTPTILQRTQSHPPPSAFHQYSPATSPVSPPSHIPAQSVIQALQVQQDIKRQPQPQPQQQQPMTSTISAPTEPVIEVQKYIDDPEEGEWTKVTKRRK